MVRRSYRSRRGYRAPSRRRRGMTSYRGYRRMGGGLKKLLTPGVALVTGIQQMTEKDIQFAGASFNSLSIADKLKFIASKMVGRMTGFNPFPEVAGNQSLTINPAGVINKWTGLGALGYLYGKYGDGLPFRSYASKLGKGALIGGIWGGFFDPPAVGSPNYNAGIQDAKTNVSAPLYAQGGSMY